MRLNRDELVRRRRAQGFTQEGFAEAVGVDRSTVIRWESGRTSPQPWVRTAIASALDVSLDELDLLLMGPSRTDVPAPDAPKDGGRASVAAVDTVGAADPALEDDVRRRELLASALSLGAGMVVGSTTVATDKIDLTAALERALFDPQPARPVPLRALAEALTRAHADFTTAQYTSLGQRLPQLITTAEATRDSTTGRAREHANAVVARSYVLASELSVKRHSEMAWATADRALTAARASGDPIPVSEAARVLAITMRRAGRHDAAVALLTRTAATLDDHPDALSARASLLMTAAYTAATAGQRTTALDLLDEADATAGRFPERPAPVGVLPLHASPADVALYRIGAYNALGTPDNSVQHIAQINPAALPTPERRARYYTDVARTWHQLGQNQRTFGALRSIEQQAPEEARRPSVRTLTADLLYTAQHLPGLRAFATRTGAIT